MSMPHRIRLHAAWTRQAGGWPERATDGTDPNSSLDGLVGRPATEDTEVKVSLPDGDLAAYPAARVVYSRRFHRPTGVGPATEIWLVSGLFAVAESIWLNGARWEGSTDAERLRVTSSLLPHNELRIVIARDRFAVASQATAYLELLDRPPMDSEDSPVD